MLWITFLVALVIAAGAAAYVLWPLLSRSMPDVPIEDDRLTDLISRKDSLVSAIKDLEFDHQVGKLSEDDYQRFNARLRQQTIGYLQQIDKLAPQSEQLDASLEAEIARLRKTRITPVASNGKVAPEMAPVTSMPDEKTTSRFCTNCGQDLAPKHKFCAHCGTPAQNPLHG